jgi:hypothetical protein
MPAAAVTIAMQVTDITNSGPTHQPLQCAEITLLPGSQGTM